MLQSRAAIIKKIRSFFDNKGYLELDTPLLSPDLIPESCLEVFKTDRVFPQGSRKESYPLYLIPSPEIWMKKIIAAHRVNAYQICKCFRNTETAGRFHNSEFTMLEYYTINADYMDSLTLTERLFENLTCNAVPFERLTVAQAFSRYAGFDLFGAAAEGDIAMAEQACALGLEPEAGMTTPQLFDLIFIHAVEPHLKTEKPVALLDYPAFVPCLAKRAENGITFERWELYYKGMELANCYSEETDPQKVKEFFTSEEDKKNRSAIVKHRVESGYYKIFKDFPRCSGVAMGLDRLIMALCGRSCIDMVMPFTEQHHMTNL